MKSLAKTPFLAEHDVVPQLPHLIIVPGTIQTQWEVELKAVFLPQSVDILIYKGGKARESFWSPDGPFYSSKHKLGSRIIIATHSVGHADPNYIFLHSNLS